MLPESLARAALGLFSICVVASMMDALMDEGGLARAFRSVCALASSVWALRVILRFLK